MLSRFYNPCGRIILAVAGCMIVSIISFLIFLPFSQNITVGLPELCNFLIQLGGCILVGWKIAQKTSCDTNQRDKEKFFSTVRFILPILLILYIIYLFFPKLNWKISDFILYAGVENQIDYSLQNCALWKLFLIKKIISFEAILSYISCFAAYVLGIKKLPVR